MALAAERPAHGDAAQASEHQQVDERLALGRHADGVDPDAQLVACERPVRGERAFDGGDSTLRSLRSHAAQLVEAPRRCR